MVQKKSMDDISVLEMEHPLSEVKTLDFWLHLNRGPFHLPGDGSTLNVNWKDYDEKTGKFYTVVGPTMRYVLDWADIDAFTIHTNLGQSGNPLSPHYDDFLDIWLKGEQWVVPFSREKVYAGKASLLRLMPQSSK
jgi:penicillin amidase